MPPAIHNKMQASALGLGCWASSAPRTAWGWPVIHAAALAAASRFKKSRRTSLLGLCGSTLWELNSSSIIVFPNARLSECLGVVIIRWSKPSGLGGGAEEPLTPDP